MSLGRQASWAKITSPVKKQTAPACHPTKKLNSVVTYISLSKHCLEVGK